MLKLGDTTHNFDQTLILNSSNSPLLGLTLTTLTHIQYASKKPGNIITHLPANNSLPSNPLRKTMESQDLDSNNPSHIIL